MTRPFLRRTLPRTIQDHHTRIRRLEASPGGSDPATCPDCVLDPYTVNPGDIVVPPAYYGCVDVAPSLESQPVDQCGPGDIFIVSGMDIGYCSAYALGSPLGLQLRASVAFAPCFAGFNGAMTANISNLILYAGNPEVQVASWTWTVAGTVGQSPCVFDSGWVDIAPVCAGSCTALSASMSFESHNVVTGACGNGSIAARWVELDANDEYRGALDDLPQGEAFGDVIHFNSVTHEFVVGPRSVPSRAIATFMGD